MSSSTKESTGQSYFGAFVKGFIKFAFVGGIGYFEGLGLYYVETRFLHLYDLVAVTIAFLIVVFSNLVGNILVRNIRPGSLGAIPRIAAKFYLTATVGYFEGLAIFYVETRYLFVFDLLALTISTGLVALSNYGGNILLRNIRPGEERSED